MAGRVEGGRPGADHRHPQGDPVLHRADATSGLALPCPTVVRALTKAVVVLVCALALGAGAWIGKLWWDSRLPGTYSVMDYGTLDYGGRTAPQAGHEDPAQTRTSVADLHGPRAGTPDAMFTLTAKRATLRLTSGREVDALTFNGRSPGPELRVRQGELVEVTLENEDVSRGVTLHWHGVDVPNAEDGVAGVTQDAVLPGEHYVYRFRADQLGTFWYHTHQASSKEVRRGLFGVFVIEPPQGVSGRMLDLALVSHTFEGVPTLNGNDGVEQRAVDAGMPVRLRLVNSENAARRFMLSGTPFRVVAIDGTELNEPPPLENVSVEVSAGGRADLEFTMPTTPVRLSLDGTAVGLSLSPDGTANPSAALPGSEFQPWSYGRPTTTPFDASSSFDRRFELTIGRKPGFFNGRPGMQWTINGDIYPRVPAFVVKEGDLVQVTIENDTDGVHPMHLHGHHLLVLSRDGVPVSGSPWWVDTLHVEQGVEYLVAFRADNPGIWMYHCHNLRHAGQGLTMHVAYEGVATPFKAGDSAHNHPE
ncbi:MAG: multicopper oxidase family protein [Actinobacteria bacterium]|nr:multicopper oxidase family protein [Actinomycetota bacterium]